MFKSKRPPTANPKLRQTSIKELFNQYKRKKYTHDPSSNTSQMDVDMDKQEALNIPSTSDYNATSPETATLLTNKTENKIAFLPSDTKEFKIEEKPRQISSGPRRCYTSCNLHPSKSHIVLFKVLKEKWHEDHDLSPHPSTYTDLWDQAHVRMPCSPRNLIPLNGTLHGRWALIEAALLNNFSSSYDIEEAILSYNPQYSQSWDFRGLHSYFHQAEEEEKAQLLSVVVPGMAQLALQLPSLVTQAPPLLKQGQDMAVSMTQAQIASLLANAFFCTFPRRTLSRKRATAEYSNFPDINFNRLFIGQSQSLQQLRRRQMKLKTLFHYFSKVLKSKPNGVLTFHRQHLEEFPDWAHCSDPLVPLEACLEGRIEKEGAGKLQVDFANSFVGGGVLGLGCVQEEIRFLICPELLVTRLLTERLGPTEALLVKGCEQFSDYSGYSDTFTWEGDFQDQTPKDQCGRRCTEIVAIDALHLRKDQDQYMPDKMKRELNKAYCGFYSAHQPELLSVATGNWGCGAFGGDPELKSLLQWMAASAAHRAGMTYFTFHNQQLQEGLTAISAAFQGRPVAQLWHVLTQFSATQRPSTLFPFLLTPPQPTDDSTQ